MKKFWATGKLVVVFESVYVSETMDENNRNWDFRRKPCYGIVVGESKEGSSDSGVKRNILYYPVVLDNGLWWVDCRHMEMPR